MRFPLRFALPVLLAFACASALLAFLWWQLMMSARIVTPRSGTGAVVRTPLSPSFAFNPSDTRDEALVHIRQGDVLSLRGEWAEAQKEYQKAVDSNGGLTALRKLAQAQMQRRDINGVKETVRALQKNGARSEDILLIESIVMLRTGELLKAQSLLDAAEDSPQKSYGLALLAIVQANHDEANKRLAEVAGGWEPILRSYARTLQAAYDEYGLFPESPDIHLVTLLSRSLAQVQECELALPLLVQVTQMQDDYRDAWIVQGYCELVTERFEQSLSSLERAYALDPQKPEIQYFLARTYAALADHGNAITFFEYALTNGFEPQSEVRRWIARSAIAEGNAPLALEQYQKMSQLSDATFDVFISAVETALLLEKKEEAVAIATKGTERFPEEADMFVLLGKAWIEAEEVEKAKSALQTAISMDSSLSEAVELLHKL